VNLLRKRDKADIPGQNSLGTPDLDYPFEALPAGFSAPEFKLAAPDGREISLTDFRGQPVILAFYPADWSPTCGDQMSLYNEVLPIFEEYNAQLLGISVDGRWSHQAYTADRNLRFPLLADFEPKGEVSRRYGVYNHDAGLSLRALFVIDPEGRIQWSYVSPPGVNPGADGILSALESIKS
jgi:peroxiredoxin